MKEDKDNQPVVAPEEPPTEEPPIPEEVHQSAAALARALFEVDE